MFKVSDVRLNKVVANVLLATTNESYLADMFLPTISQKNDTGEVPQWGDAHMREYKLERAANDTSLHYVEVEAKGNIEYKIRDYDVTHKVPVKLIEQQEDPYSLLAQSGISAREIMKLNRDIALAEQLTNTSVLTKNVTLSGSAQWSDETSSPYTNIEAGKTSVLLNTGAEGNSIYMSYNVATALRSHPEYQNLFSGGKGNVAGGVPLKAFEQLLKDVHGFDNVFIGKTTKITSKQGQSTITREFVFGNDCVVFHRATAPSIMTASFGYSFVTPKKNLNTAAWLDPVGKKFYNVEAKLSFEDKILMPDAAYLIKNCI